MIVWPEPSTKVVRYPSAGPTVAVWPFEADTSANLDRFADGLTQQIVSAVEFDTTGLGDGEVMVERARAGAGGRRREAIEESALAAAVREGAAKVARRGEVPATARRGEDEEGREAERGRASRGHQQAPGSEHGSVYIPPTHI